MKKLLFVCIENACRSQIAEAFARRLGGDKVEVYSAGSQPARKVNRKAIEAMKPMGYDLARHRPKSVHEVPDDRYDFVITMGCGDECPHIPAEQREDWDIQDPKDYSQKDFQEVRDEIQGKVKGLIKRLGIS